MTIIIHRPPRLVEQTAEATCGYCHAVIYREYTAEVWDEALSDYVKVAFVRGSYWQRDDGPKIPVCSCPTAKKHPITEAVADLARPLDAAAAANR